MPDFCYDDGTSHEEETPAWQAPAVEPLAPAPAPTPTLSPSNGTDAFPHLSGEISAGATATGTVGAKAEGKGMWETIGETFGDMGHVTLELLERGTGLFLPPFLTGKGSGLKGPGDYEA